MKAKNFLKIKKFKKKKKKVPERGSEDDLAREGLGGAAAFLLLEGGIVVVERIYLSWKILEMKNHNRWIRLPKNPSLTNSWQTFDSERGPCL